MGKTLGKIRRPAWAIGTPVTTVRVSTACQFSSNASWFVNRGKGPLSCLMLKGATPVAAFEVAAGATVYIGATVTADRVEFFLPNAGRPKDLAYVFTAILAYKGKAPPPIDAFADAAGAIEVTLNNSKDGAPVTVGFPTVGIGPISGLAVQPGGVLRVGQNLSLARIQPEAGRTHNFRCTIVFRSAPLS